MNHAGLPYMQSKRFFDRLAPYLGEALRMFPSAVIIDPRKESMSAETFAGYLRKARQAKLDFGYMHSSVDEELFKQHADALVIAYGKPPHHTGMVIVGPRNYGEVKHSVANGAVKSISSGSTRIEVDLKWVGEVCGLLSAKALSPAPEFIVTGIERLAVEKYEATYDVAFVPLDEAAKQYQIL